MGYKDITFSPDTVFLVTGGAGFIGSNLCEAILKKGCKVRCLDDLSTGDIKNTEIFKDNPDYTFIKGDIKDYDTCLEATNGVDFVLNQAAWGSVPRSIEMPQISVLSEITFRKMLRLSAPTRRRVAISLARKPVRAVVILI